MNKFLKNTLLLLTLSLSVHLMYGQYVPAFEPETSYDNMVPFSCSFNDVGTDTRDGGSTGYGYGSPYYANFMNVTVNSCQGMGTSGNPGFYWESSFGTSGSSALPGDAYDPDVVMVSPGGDAAPADIDRIWAIAVYYSASNGGYCMSIAEFIPGPYTFTPMSAPILIQAYSPVGFEPHINIDSDNYGRYAVVMQMNGGILSKTQTLFTTPTVPTNDIWQGGLIEPDIACLGNSAFQSNIVALNIARDQYHTVSRPYLPLPPFGLYTSSVRPDLYQPRIAAPSTGSIQEYAVTVAQKYPIGANIIYDILLQVDGGVITPVNTGALGYPAGLQLNNNNTLPCLTYSYYYSGGSLAEQISMGWYTESVPGIFPIPNQPTTFLGLDIDPVTLLPSDPSRYLDITNFNGSNNESVMAISGRFSSWAKSAAFTYAGPIPFFASELMWKIVPSPALHWKKPADQNALADMEKETITLFPNPATAQVHLALNSIEDGYTFEVMNQLGQTIHRAQMEVPEVTIAVDQWPAGLYFVKVKNKTTGEVRNLKFIKN